MRTVVIIPARYASTRFPGKPLAPVAGVMMIERVWRIASQLTGIAGVYVATDDDRIAAAVKGFGGQVIMTPADCENGTERVYMAATQLAERPDSVINFQGDAVLTPPWVVQPLVDVLNQDPTVQLATPMMQLDERQYAELVTLKESSPASGTTVTFDSQYNALYFSKNIIPHVRAGGVPEVYRHIGMYGYRLETLAHYLTLPSGRFEQLEKLEQLRALENGIPIRMVPVDYRGRTHGSIDSPADLNYAEEIIAREGELI